MNEKSIGFRVTPAEIFFAIIDNQENDYEFISISSLKVPVSLDEPYKLSFVRNTILTIINQYKIQYAGIKLIEGNARNSINNNMIFRFKTEGVLMELFANSSIKKYFLGISKSIASVLEIETCKTQEMLDSIIDTSILLNDNGKKITGEAKEAMLIGLAALEAGLKNE